MKKPIIAIVLLFVLLSCEKKSKTSSESFNPNWEESFPGVWQTTINQPEDFNLLSVANKPPRSETLNKKTKQQFPLSNKEIKTFTKKMENLHSVSSGKGRTDIRVWLEL